MHIAEKIYDRVKKLPEEFQKEVLDFTEFLAKRIKRNAVRDEELEWNALSLNQAFRDFNDDEEPVYHESDIKEKW